MPSLRPGAIESLRERLAAEGAPRQWGSLEELAGTEAFREWMAHELPEQAERWPEGLSRRGFLQLVGASLALAGVTGCTRQPLEQILPYTRQPETLVPGVPQLYATSLTLGGYATGVLVECHEGRPTKVEGNPLHPASLGASGVLEQAAILSLYDPERSRAVTHRGRITTWAAAQELLAGALEGGDGEGAAVLTGATTSPSLERALAALRERFPRVAFHRHEAVPQRAARLAARAAFGRELHVRHDLAGADVVVALESDPLGSGPWWLRHAHDVMARRDPDRPEGWNRLYVAESCPTPSGSAADHRLPLAPAQWPGFLLALAREVGVEGLPAGAAQAARARLGAREGRFLSALAGDLRARPGRGALLLGEPCPPEAHVLAHAIDAALGNLGSTRRLGAPLENRDEGSLSALAAALRAGEVRFLLVLGANPAYDAPGGLRFAEALSHAGTVVHAGLHRDETAAHAHWHLPLAHELESWGDARAFDGTLGVQQPLIEPLHGGRSPLEILASLSGRKDAVAREMVRETWREILGDDPLDERWRRVLHDGLLAGSEAPDVEASLDGEAVARAAAALAEADARVAAEAQPAAGPGRTLEIALRPDPSLHDGRFANNAWLQECPKPITKLTWENALLVAPADAERLGLAHEELARVTALGGAHAARAAGGPSGGEPPELLVPVWILPGHARGAATLHLGHGRRAGGLVGEGRGTDAYVLRASESAWSVTARVEGTGSRRRLASTQHHFTLSGLALESAAAAERDLVRSGGLEDYRSDPGRFAQPEREAEHRRSLMPGFASEGHAWALSIDLTRCTGCNACVVACQAENNVPSVGREQVIAGREMHWLRIDRYFEGSLDDPVVHHQPVPCMHCEQAPCETVCPVGATVHSDEGLNDMVYNRCVGTRYCSNNCPYKVRRFGFLDWNAGQAPVRQLAHNPDVSVRERGVMEKCTYCVQRISRARSDAGREGRPIRDGEVVTACQQACPTSALVFGDRNDPASAVSRRRASPLDYGLLAHLGTRPRTTYRARLRNLHPGLEG